MRLKLLPNNSLHSRRAAISMNTFSDYTPPKIWSATQENGGRFASINRPTAGPTHDKDLPVGRHPLQLYSQGTPNGVKVTVMLEELLAAGHPGAEYDAWLIRIQDSDQFSSGFVSANPNSKIPALVDRSGLVPIKVFESGAILIYLAEKFGAFLPLDGVRRAECLSWLFWQMGSAPFLGGGFGHFYAYAPVKIKYAIDRYAMDVKRQLDVLDHRLAESLYLAGEEYTIADGPGTAHWSRASCMKRENFCRSRPTAMCCAGPTRSPSVQPCGVAALSTAWLTFHQANCMSAMTPATSTPRPRTSWAHRSDAPLTSPVCPDTVL